MHLTLKLVFGTERLFRKMNRYKERVMKPSIITACNTIGISEKWISSNHTRRGLLIIGVALLVLGIVLMFIVAGLGHGYKHLLEDWILASMAWRLIIVESVICIPVMLFAIGLGLIKNYLRLKEDYRYKIFLLLVYKELISTGKCPDDAIKMIYDVLAKNFLNNPAGIL